jgi:hypothetical protein
VFRIRKHPDPLIEGANSLSNSGRLAARSRARNDRQVAFPPGRAKLATRPASTGSPLKPNTTGTDWGSAACRADRDNQTHLGAEDFLNQSRKSGIHPACKAAFENEIDAFDVTGAAHPLQEYAEVRI